jgi:hypothetical protein
MTTYQRLSRIRKADVFDDTLSAASVAAIEGSSVDHEDFLGGLLSQFKRVVGGTDWYSAVQDAALDPRNLKTITDDIYFKRILRRRANLTDITVPSAAFAVGSITVVAGSALVDGTDTFTINDGVNAATVFEFDSGGGVSGANIAVPFTGGDSVATVKASVISAINGVTTTLRVTATDGGGAIVTLTADIAGTNANRTVTETVADGGFAVTGLAGGAGDQKTLSAAGTETPSETAAVGAGSANGAVVATLTADVGQHALTEVAGLNAITPKTLLLIRDAATFDPVLSGGREVYGLLQAETGVVDGEAFNDTAKQAQISFVRQNAAGDDLEACPGADIAGKIINYSYVSRSQSYLLNEQDFLVGTFQDPQSAAATTLQEAYTAGNQVDVLTAEGHLIFNLSQDLTEFRVQRNSTSFAYLKRDDTLGDSLTLDLDTLDVNNANDADFLNGAAFDTGGTTINVGVTAGQIDATALVARATTGNLTVHSNSGEVQYRDVRETTALPFTDATAGAISALPGGPYASISAAIRSALLSADLNIYTQVLQASYAQDANVPGSGNGNAQDWSPVLSFATKSIDMNTPAGVDTLIIYNGAVLFGGNGTTNNDVYVGTTAASGDLKYDFTKGVKSGDTVLALSWNAS